MDQTPEWAPSHEIRDGFLIGYIRDRTDGVQGGDNIKNVFVEQFWKDVEGHYDKMRVQLLEYCKAKINVPADFESRVKSPGSIKKSIERREAARIQDGEQPYNSLEDIRADVHDLVGIRIVVDLTPHLDEVNKWIKLTFNQDKEPIPFHADRVIGQNWTPWFGAYYCCNHHISVKPETMNHLAPYAKVMFEIQVTCLSERLYNKLAHPLLYKGTQENLSRKDEMVIDMAHAMSLCYSMCLLYFKDSKDADLISTIKKTLSASGVVEEEESSTELREQISKNTTFTPNIPLSFLSDGHSSKTIKRQDVVSLMDDFRNESTSKDMTLAQMKTIVEEAIKEANAPELSLPEVPTARFDNKEVREAPRCHEHTRASIIEKIEEWIDNAQLRETAMWIGAPAGTGKSTLARTIAERCEGRDILAATYFFRRGAEDTHRNGTARLLPTIANQLAANIPRFRASLHKSMNQSHMRVNEADQRGLDIQLETLVQNPLSALSPNRGAPKIVVIDAIDECDEATNIAQVIQKLATLKAPAARWLHFIFTSREADYIRTTFQALPHHPILLHKESRHETKEDVRAYLTYNFAKIKTEKHIDGNWPQDDDISFVVQRATTPTPLFIYASTLLRYIHNEKGSLNTVKKFKTWITQCKNNQSQLGGLYTPILKNALLENADDKDDNDKEEIQKFLASIACAFEPLSASTLSSLLSIDLDSIKHWLANLHPVLQVPKNDEYPIQILHESFRDFLLAEDELKDPKLVAGAHKSHLILVEEYLRRLSPAQDPYPPLGIFRNVPKPEELGGWSDEDDMMGNLCRRSDYSLRYAGRYWAQHWVKGKQFDDDFCEKMEVHLRKATFPWIEAVTVMEENGNAIECICSLLENTMNFHTQAQLRLKDLLAKVCLFLVAQTEILIHAPLQTCLSASIFCPAKYEIKQSLCSIRVPFVRNIIGDPAHWVPNLSNVFPTGLNLPIEYWGDTTLCAISTHNTALMQFPIGNIRLYDLEKGACTKDYTIDDRIVALSFDEDCRGFYSVSSGGRVDLWNVESGYDVYQFTLEKCPPLTKIAISTNKHLIVAPLPDRSKWYQDVLGVWNMEDGSRAGELQCSCPSSKFKNIAVSPDGTKVASLFRTGNFSDNVDVWELQANFSQKAVEGPISTLKLPSPGYGLCFTPCGSRLLVPLSSSLMVYDYKIDLCWGVPNFSSRLEIDYMNFLPGTYSLLTTGRNAIHVWDLSSIPKYTRIKSHSSSNADSLIKTMTLSPDQKTLATSSAKHSLLIWNLETMARLFDLSEIGYSIVEAMTFSADGTMLAVLNNNLVQLWRIYGDSRPRLICVTQQLPVPYNPSKIYPAWDPSFRGRDLSTLLLFPSPLPSGDMIIKICRNSKTSVINTQTGKSESGRWDLVKQAMSVSEEWLRYTDREGCTRDIIYLPTHYEYHSFACSGGKVVMGDVDGEFSIIDLDIDELEEYSHSLTNRERLEEGSKDDSGNK